MICHFPEYREFIRNCRKAEAEAKRTGKMVHFGWRGCRSTIAANLPTITTPGLELRMMNALHKISTKTIPETLVKKKKN